MIRLLFSPLKLRDLTLKKRVVISPMCQYSAIEGMANDWQLVRLAKFATGSGLVFTEAAALQLVQPPAILHRPGTQLGIQIQCDPSSASAAFRRPTPRRSSRSPA